jgi:hypothetical protein
MGMGIRGLRFTGISAGYFMTYTFDKFYLQKTAKEDEK